MGYYAIGALIVVAGALGFAYVTIDPFAPDQEERETAAVSDVQNDREPAPEAAPRPAIVGSADRRMDDFGSGPGGATVTVPLRNRHQQAYSGSTAGGGGGPRETSNGSAQDGGAETPEIETAVLSSETEEGDTPGPEPTFRVIERGADEGQAAEGQAPEGDAASPEPNAAPSADADIEPEAGPENAPVLETKSDIAPSFDVVRVSPGGTTVIAGRAAPLSDVEIKVGSEVIDRVTATATGEWVSTPIEPLASGDQEISLMAMSGDGAPIESRQIVVVSVPEAVTPEGSPEDQTVAVVVDKDEGGEGRILQAPDRLESAGDERLALKLVDYDDEGAIRLSGEAPPGVPVRIYVDNEPAALVIGNSEGYWITTLDQELPAGDYVLRLDQLDTKGQTIARLETPLTREATPPVEGNAEVDYVVVQPGNSLWRIARRLSGDGFNYVYIFEANQAQIRDPDVIYPGQVFEVPTSVSAEIAG